MFSGNKDADKYVLEKLGDRDLLNMCKTNKYFRNICNDETFWRARFLRIFGKHAANYKPENRSWKMHYLKVVRDINFLNNGDISNLEGIPMRSYNWWFFYLIIKDSGTNDKPKIRKFNYEAYMKLTKNISDIEDKFGVFYDIMNSFEDVLSNTVEESGEIAQNIYWLSYLAGDKINLYDMGTYTLDYFKDKDNGMWEYPKYFTPAKVMKILEDYFNGIATEEDIEKFRDYAHDIDIDYNEDDIILGKTKRKDLNAMLPDSLLHEVTAFGEDSNRIPEIGKEIDEKDLRFGFLLKH